MNAYDETSLQCIENAASTLGGTDAVRAMVQAVYNLGLNDGSIRQLKAQITNLDAEKREAA